MDISFTYTFEIYKIITIAIFKIITLVGVNKFDIKLLIIIYTRAFSSANRIAEIMEIKPDIEYGNITEMNNGE